MEGPLFAEIPSSGNWEEVYCQIKDRVLKVHRRLRLETFASVSNCGEVLFQVF